MDIGPDEFYPTSGSIPCIGLGHAASFASMDVCALAYDRTSGSLSVFLGVLEMLTASGTMPLAVFGHEPRPATVCPALDPAASIQIPNELILVYQDKIDALINQLGKNVHLEFDPIKTICPNCEYDSIAQRSRGIYKGGGPVPFAAGRQCPYCKGKGFFDRAVEECIKALTRWNPKDAQNYGISVREPTAVVRLKTYLVHAPAMILRQVGDRQCGHFGDAENASEVDSQADPSRTARRQVLPVVLGACAGWLRSAYRFASALDCPRSCGTESRSNCRTWFSAGCWRGTRITARSATTSSRYLTELRSRGVTGEQRHRSARTVWSHG